MNHVKDQLPALVDAELAAAIHEHGRFHSAHEGYAVMLEEVQEAEDEMVMIKVAMKSIWIAVRNDFSVVGNEYVREVEAHAVHLAAEAIQVAAMARKMQMIQQD